MTTVYDIVRFMESIAPQSKKESWDNVGLLCGRRDKQVTTILVALDPFEDVAEEAVKLGADLIVTHHPLIFHGLRQVYTGTPVSELVQNGIALISAHTCFDKTPGGIGDRPHQSGHCAPGRWCLSGGGTGAGGHLRY